MQCASQILVEVEDSYRVQSWVSTRFLRVERSPITQYTGSAAGGGRRFVQTPSVERHLRNLARAVLLRRHPILLQGPTSSGKTSLVAYLAAQTGHHFVRINNHQQTDLQASRFSQFATISMQVACKARVPGFRPVTACRRTLQSAIYCNRGPHGLLVARKHSVIPLMACRSTWAATSRTRPGGWCSGRARW